MTIFGERLTMCQLLFGGVPIIVRHTPGVGYRTSFPDNEQLSNLRCSRQLIDFLTGKLHSPDQVKEK